MFGSFMRIFFEPKIIKKAFCSICGKRMSRRFILLNETTMYKPFGLPFKERKLKYKLLLPVYCCKSCNYEIKYDDQKMIRHIQEKEETKILKDGKKLVKQHSIK